MTPTNPKKLSRGRKLLNPVNINEDIWFYVNKNSFDFVVWVEIDGKRKAAQFRITHKKLKKYL